MAAVARATREEAVGLTHRRPLAALVLTAPVRALKVAFPRDLRQGRALHHRRPCRQPAVSRTLCAEGGHRCGQGGSAVPERDGDRDAQVQSEAQRGRARDGTPTAASYGWALHEDRRDRRPAVSGEKRGGENVRNGDWGYQTLKADRAVPDKAQFHGPASPATSRSQDCVFSVHKMRTAK